MGKLVTRGIVSRPAKTPNERLHVRREGELRKWHARTEDGELICCDKYRADIESFVQSEGYSPVFVD